MPAQIAIRLNSILILNFPKVTNVGHGPLCFCCCFNSIDLYYFFPEFFKWWSVECKVNKLNVSGPGTDRMNLTEHFMINVEDHSSKSFRIEEEHIYCLVPRLAIQITNQRYIYVCSCIYLESFYKSFQHKQLYIWKDLSENHTHSYTCAHGLTRTHVLMNISIQISVHINRHICI